MFHYSNSYLNFKESVSQLCVYVIDYTLASLSFVCLPSRGFD